MKLLIKNKFMSLKGNSKVFDEEGNVKFIVQGKVFSISRKKKIFDENKNLLYKVRTKFWHLPYKRKVFIYDKENEKVACVVAKYAFNKKFYIEGYKDEISILGNLFGLHYSICKNGDVMGTLDKKFISLVDTFTLEIVKEEDAPFMVAVVIAIDNVTDARAASNNNN